MSSHSLPLAVEPVQHLYLGDALHMLAKLPTSSVHAVITDPPYAIKPPSASAQSETVRQRPDCLSAGCQPGDLCADCVRDGAVSRFAESNMLGQQSQNWHAKETHSRGYADNDPREFQTWCQLWLLECFRILKPGGHLVAFGGTRTWHRLATAAEDSGFEIRDSLAWLYSSGMPKSLNVERALAAHGHRQASTTWSGSGTALKPAFEPIVLGRKPLDGTMVQNVTKWGVGPLRLSPTSSHNNVDGTSGGRTAPGKWPSNVHIDGHQAAELESLKGQDASQFFWVSKPNRHERVVVDGVAHPTVKPLDLMRHLVRLVTPDQGVVVDPFAGSGTTIEACIIEGRGFIGIEKDPAYVPLIRARIARQHTNASIPASPFKDLLQDPAALTDDELRLF